MDELKIKAGQNVSIIKNLDKSITLFIEQKEETESIAILYANQNDSGDAVKRKIIAVYLAGYKIIKIKTKGLKILSEHVASIRELVRSSMIGTEIVESNSEIMTVQVLTTLPDLSFESALTRMYLMTATMIKESVEALENVDLVYAEEIINMDDEVDRFGLYIRRNLILAVENKSILQEMGLKRPSECIEYRTIVSKIERIGDHAGLIAKRIKFIKEDIESHIDKIKKLSEMVLQVFEESIRSVQNNDFQKAEKAAEKIKSIVDEEEKIISSIKDSEKNSTVIRFVLEDLRRIAEYSSDIAEVAIDENIHSIINKK